MLARFLFAALTLSLAVAINCGGSVVLDAPDPKACAAGHGCPMVGCACGDGSLVLDTTCELGECLAIDDVCQDRCKDFEGVKGSFATEDDEVPIPNCDSFCSRLAINGCELGCETLFSACLTPSTCGSAVALWDCINQDGVITCDDNAVRVVGCDTDALAACKK